MMYKHFLFAEHRLWPRYLSAEGSNTLSDLKHGLSSNPDSSRSFQHSSQLQWLNFSQTVIR